MYKQWIHLLTLVAFCSSLGRYSGLRIPTNIGPKKITIINNSDETMYLRLKPTYTHIQCEECQNKIDLQTSHDDDCCSKKVKIEYKVDAHSQLTVGLTVQEFTTTEEDTETVDYTKLIYGKIHTFDKKQPAYIRLVDGGIYTVESDTFTIRASCIKS